MRKSFAAAQICLLMLLLGAIAAPAADPCDRKCLESHVDDVLDAMVNHDARRLRLAKDIRYTENGVELVPGDGLWGTASARGAPWRCSARAAGR